MDIVRISNKRVGALFAAGVLLFATMLPALASAATITTRSIAMSTSTKSATAVVYDVEFTSEGDTKDFVIDYCTTPEIGTTCTAPAGLDVTNAGTGTAGYSETAVDSNTTVITLTSAGKAIDVEVNGIVNPSTAGVFYARITTYAGAHAYTNATTLGAYEDSGVVALSATDGFDVGGTVEETLTFCASGAAIAQPDCSDAVSADIELGDDGVLSEALATGSVYTQLSTNAAHGAVVSLKSSAAGCGGLVREGGEEDTDEGCAIQPVHTAPAAIGASAAKFGMLISNVTETTGNLQVLSLYEDTDYFFNYDTSGDDLVGVTSPYGDPILDTDGEPVSLGQAELTFGANISSVTPAGKYSAAMSLIATGTF